MTALRTSQRPQLHRPDSKPSLPIRRRAVWHQRLIDAEGGMRLGLRSSSTLYVHLFAATIVCAVGTVLSLAFLEWLLILGCLAVVVAAELFNLAVGNLVQAASSVDERTRRNVLRIATAATLTVVFGALLITGAILVRQLSLLLG